MVGRCFALLFLIFSLEAKNGHDDFLVHAIPKCGTHFIRLTLGALLGEEEHVVNKLCSHDLIANRTAPKFLRFFAPYTQEAEALIREENYKLIAMIRDPRDALLSLVLYLRKFEGHGETRDFFKVDPDFDQMTLDQQLLSVMIRQDRESNYLMYYRDRLGWVFSQDAYPLRYENLVGSQGGGDDLKQFHELMQLAQFLGAPITEERALELGEVIYQNVPMMEKAPRGAGSVEVVEGKEFHHAKIGEWKKFFTAKHKKICKKVWGQLLIDLNYEEDFEW